MAETKQSFTLAREQAILKLRESASRSPIAFLLELLRAAVLRDANAISFDLSESQFTIAWTGGAPLSHDELSQLFEFLFADVRVRQSRSLRHLAAALNSMMLNRRDRIWLESGDGTPAGSFTARPQPDGSVEVRPSDVPIPGTLVHIERHSAMFRRNSVPPIARLLLEKAPHCPIPIWIGGRHLGPVEPDHTLYAPGLATQQVLEEDDFRGIVGKPLPDVAPGYQIVVGGVIVCTRVIEELGATTAGVLQCDYLRLTADGADIVADDMWQEMIGAAQRRLLPLLSDKERPAQLIRTRDITTDSLPQLDPRPALTLDTLRELATSQPLFATAPQSVLSRGPHLNPSTFPWPVLYVDRATLADLAEALGQHPVQLKTAEDARFFREMLHRADPVYRSRPIQRGDLFVTVHLTASGQGPRFSTAPGTPVVVVRQEHETVLPALPLALPGAWVVVHDEGSSHYPSDLLRDAALHACADLLDRYDLPALRRALAQQLARPCFDPRDEPWTVRLDLPASLLRHREALCHEPLVGAFSAADLAAVQGTDEVLTLDTGDDPAGFGPLEARLGTGHLDHPSRNQRLLFAVGRGEGPWTWLDHHALQTGGLTDLLLLGGSLRPQATVPGFVVVGSPGPGLLQLVAEGCEPSDPFAGTSLMARRLLDPAEDAPTDPVARGMAQLVIAHTLGEQTPLTTGQGVVAASKLRERPAFRVRPTGGKRTDEPLTVAMTLDELRFTFTEGRPPLRYDDPPTTWHQPPAHAVVQVHLDEPDLRGWLALPRPFDPTLLLVARFDGEDHIADRIGDPWPSRGVIEVDLPYGNDHRWRVALYQRELYTLLADHLHDEPDDEDARAYVAALRNHDDPLTRTLRQQSTGDSQRLGLHSSAVKAANDAPHFLRQRLFEHLKGPSD